MPNVKGPAAKTKKGFSKNVAAEVRAGKPAKQAVAIAHSYAGTDKDYRGVKKKTGKKV